MWAFRRAHLSPLFFLLTLYQALWPPSCPIDSPNTLPAQAMAMAHGWAVCALNRKLLAEGMGENRHPGFCLPRLGPGMHPLRGVIFSNQHTCPCSCTYCSLFFYPSPTYPITYSCLFCSVLKGHQRGLLWPPAHAPLVSCSNLHSLLFYFIELIATG